VSGGLGTELSIRLEFAYWEDVHVRSRTGVWGEEGGTFISNCIFLKPVKTAQTYPTVTLAGPGAVSRLNSILFAYPGSELDIGGRVILQAPRTRADVIARSLTVGGKCLSRGHLIGQAPEIEAHLECRGLILSPTGIIYAIAELEGQVARADMSPEAAVGKIAAEEAEYLIARGLDTDEAISTIVRSFIKVKIEGLPPALEEEMERAIQSTGKGL
jgi:Fe-S cluster assembly scaffold protein SufB